MEDKSLMAEVETQEDDRETAKIDKNDPGACRHDKSLPAEVEIQEDDRGTAKIVKNDPGACRYDKSFAAEVEIQEDDRGTAKIVKNDPGACRHDKSFPAEVEIQEDDHGTAKIVKNDPGACRYGNFMNYYKFHSAEERTEQLPRGVWTTSASQRDRKYLALDVGCNAGDLTVSLEKFLRQETNDSSCDVHLLGIDIDPRLVDRARENNENSNNFLTFQCLDVTDDNTIDFLRRHLEKFSRTRFDAVFCFSVTMWIHINHGDQGLTNFLEIISSIAEIVVIEPQSWKCYRNASRRLRRAGHLDFPFLNKIQLNDDIPRHIDRVISNLGHLRRIIVTSPNQWGRQLLIYKNIQLP